jgi:hypothetical protein
VAFFGIDGSLKRLERLAAAILDATEASLTRRVQAYAKKNRDEELERHVWQVILARFPNLVPERDRKEMLLNSPEASEASEEIESSTRFGVLLESTLFSGLFRALFKSSIFRHYRIIYERERRLKDLNQPPSMKSPGLAGKSTGQSDLESHQPPTKPEEVQAMGFTTPLTNPTLENADGTQSERPSTLPNTIDIPRFTKSMEATDTTDTSIDGGYTVSESGNAMYPKAPRLPMEALEGICPLCGECCSADTFKEKVKWR